MFTCFIIFPGLQNSCVCFKQIVLHFYNYLPNSVLVKKDTVGTRLLRTSDIQNNSVFLKQNIKFYLFQNDFLSCIFSVHGGIIQSLSCC